MKDNYVLPKKNTHKKMILNNRGFESFSFIPYLFFYLSFLYFEFLVRIYTVPDFWNRSILYIPLILCFPSFVFGFISNRKKYNLQKAFTSISLVLLIIYYCAQLVIHHIFGFYLSISTFSLTGQAISYYKEALLGVKQCWYQLLLTTFPLIAYILLTAILKKPTELLQSKKKKKNKLTLALFVSSIITYLLFVFFVSLSENDTYSPYDLYFNTNNYDISVPVFGAIGSSELDLYRTIFGFHAKDTYDLSIPVDHSQKIDDPIMLDPIETLSPVVETATPTPTPTLIYENNVLNIDFNALNENETNEELLQLNSYFSALTPTMKNNKTGIYEGYNVIYMTCEAFSPYAVDEVLTPTLYKMANSSYVFENFYTTGDWYTSTSDGEYMMCTGLLPMSVKNTFTKTTTNNFAFALPQVLKPLGYSATAFHNNSGTVYSRTTTHTNLGYDFYYKGNGLDLSGWPESDLEMMEQSGPMYISAEPFLAYYMTVSGHLNYNFTGNSQSQKHMEEVSEMPYSDACKAYVACHIELDLAMENLLSQLETAGVADHTIIVMVADHYPYGLEDEEISEFLGHPVETTFERYQSTLILYTPGKIDSEIVTKPCEAIDVLPTLLNMLGSDYDSRLITGRDIFAEEPGLVIFPSRSFITEDYSFNFKGKEVIPFVEREITKEEVLEIRKNIDNAFYVSSKIAELDYYQLIDLESSTKFE